ncbi:biopolymer transporter ExbD [Candidatus Sumerlaeota bacterium]|nr:biopolymer transporter ExbD [Candidatus Sumerlaeota bacterium]
MNARPTVVDSEDEEMNLTPLLDCIFILIFFFLVATTIREDEARLEVRLPEAPIESTAQQREAIGVVITAEGEIFIGGEMIPRGALETRLAEITETRPGDPVEIVSDGEAPMQAFVDVVSALVHLGIPFADVRAEPATGAPRL